MLSPRQIKAIVHAASLAKDAPITVRVGDGRTDQAAVLIRDLRKLTPDHNGWVRYDDYQQIRTDFPELALPEEISR